MLVADAGAAYEGIASMPPPPTSAFATPPGVSRKGYVSARAVGSFVPRLTRTAFEKHGFATAELITEWAGIVGADVAAYTRPLKLRWPRLVGTDAEAASGRPSATLVIAADPARALDVQYKSRHMIEQINVYFGYRAVADLRIEQKMPAPSAAPSARRQHGTVRPVQAPASLSAISDERLRESLSRLAAGLNRDRTAK